MTAMPRHCGNSTFDRWYSISAGASCRVDDRALIQIAEQIRVTPFSQITAAEGHHDKRHSSLMRCFDWSFNYLPDFAQEGFACLGVFADTFTDESVQAVCERLDAQKVLTSLMKAALVRRLPGNTHSRYTMLPITRAYANGKFPFLSSAHAMRQLFVSYFVRLVRQNRDFEDQDKRAILEAEWKNALAASQTAEKLEDWGGHVSPFPTSGRISASEGIVGTA